MYRTMPTYTCPLNESSLVDDSHTLDVFQFWTSCFIHRAWRCRGLTIPSLQTARVLSYVVIEMIIRPQDQFDPNRQFLSSYSGHGFKRPKWLGISELSKCYTCYICMGPGFSLLTLPLLNS